MSAEPILVVDDNPANLKLMRVLLLSEGFDVSIAGDAVAALQSIDAQRPRLILMDVQLPGMDGLELTRNLKEAARTSDICIVAMTAYAMSGDEERAREAGCDGYITKPVDTRRLFAILREFLARLPGHDTVR